MRFHRLGVVSTPLFLALLALPAAAQAPCPGVCVGFAGAGVSAVPLSPGLLPVLSLLVAGLAAFAGRRRAVRALMVVALAAGLGLAPDLPRALAAAYQVVLSGGSLATVALPGGYAGPVDVHNPQAVPVTITGIEAGAGFVVDPASPLHVGSVVPPGSTVTGGIVVVVADAAPPVLIQATASASSPSAGSATFTIDEAGTGYYALRVAADPAATADALVTSGTAVVMGAHGPVTANFSGLAGATAYAVDFIARDAAGNRQAAVTTVGFTTPAANVAPVFAAVQGNLAIDNVNAMAPLVTPAATDGNGDPITYGASGLPTGLAFDPATRTLAKTGAVPPGSHTVTLTATDGIAPPVSQSFEVVVANSAPVFEFVWGYSATGPLFVEPRNISPYLTSLSCMEVGVGYASDVVVNDPDGGDITVTMWTEANADGIVQVFTPSPEGYRNDWGASVTVVTPNFPPPRGYGSFQFIYYPQDALYYVPYETVRLMVTDAGGLSTTITFLQAGVCPL